MHAIDRAVGRVHVPVRALEMFVLAPPLARQAVRPRRDQHARRRLAPAKRRLNFKEKHALASLPGEIAALQNSVRRLQKLLDDPGLYARDRQAFGQASEALAAAQSRLAASEERWLELELLREEFEGGT